MRPVRRHDEKVAIERVRGVLNAEGRVVVDDSSVSDRPDWVFDIDGVRTAAECTCINLQRLMAWAGDKRQRMTMEPGTYRAVRFANEPHLWIRKAILEKELKTAEYRQRATAAEVWLIAHSDVEPLALYECTPDMLDLMKRSAAATPSSFAQIWFAHPEAGAHRLWKQGDEQGEFPELNVDRTYPTLRVREGPARLSTADGSFSLDTASRVDDLLIQPLDTRYRL